MRLSILFSILTALLVACTNRPTVKDLDGAVKGKVSPRLADGSPISSDDADEYSPYIVELSDGYLALLFGSNRGIDGCSPGYHGILVAKSLSAFDGESLPYFAEPVPINLSGTNFCVSGSVHFGAIAYGTSVKVYYDDSGYVSSTIVNPTDGSYSSPYPINNGLRMYDTLIGISAGGYLFGRDSFGIVRMFDPNSNDPGTELPALEGAASFVHLPADLTGDEYAGIFTPGYGVAMATFSGEISLPFLALETALFESGLTVKSFGAFSASDIASNLVLFSADGNASEDIYVINSHTAGDLWALALLGGFLQ